MAVVATLTERNRDFAAHRFAPGLSIMPTLRTIIIACVDPRVDPAHVLGLAVGEAVVLRNVGGRITPATAESIALLGAIARVDGGRPGPEWNLVVLQHTDCGIARLARFPALLAGHFGVATDELAAKAVADPRAAVAVDVAALRANSALPGDFLVSGLVYDVATGLLDTVVPLAPLRGEGATV